MADRVDTGTIMIRLNRLKDAGVIRAWDRIEDGKRGWGYLIDVRDGESFFFKPREAMAFTEGARLSAGDRMRRAILENLS